MRWVLLGVAVCAFASLWGAGPEYAMYIGFVVMFANFATFCLLYDRPINRARARVAAQLRQLHPNTDTAQRLETAPIVASDEDRRLGYGPMTLLNFGTGIAAGGLLIWGIVLRMF